VAGRRRVSGATPLATWAARALALATLALLAGGGALGVASGRVPQGLPLIPFGLVGYLVARRQPGNPLGWLLLALAFVFTLATDGGLYALMVYEDGYRLPWPRLAAFLGAFWAWLVVLAPLTVALFPDGRLSRRWQVVVGLYVALSLLMIGELTWRNLDGVTAAHIRIDAQGALTTTDHTSGGTVFALALVGFCLAFIGRQLVAYRRARGEYRQQLKCLFGGGAIALTGLVLTLSFGEDANAALAIIGGVGFFALTALPFGMGVGILRYRLFEIDRVISRTLAYALLTALLAGVFVGLVVLLTDVLPVSSPVAVAASTLAAAALFTPLRLRTQQLLDRRFNRARYDAQAIVSAFSVELRHALELESIRGELLRAVEQTVAPAHASLWLKDGSATALR
jgi:hypothetical protein